MILNTPIEHDDEYLTMGSSQIQYVIWFDETEIAILVYHEAGSAKQPIETTFYDGTKKSVQQKPWRLSLIKTTPFPVAQTMTKTK